ncbi:MAG: holo-ACP synthase [Clostridiales bacterium]|nr:holo-ACP synthase [Clostridiales bacterium]
MISSGIDIVSIERIGRALEKNGEAFLRRICTEKEIELCGNGNEARKAEFFAGRFAAKEAVSKALGTGFGGSGTAAAEIEILKKDSGEPYVNLFGRAKEIYEQRGGKCLSISISHDGGMAVAFCCIEWKEERREER